MNSCNTCTPSSFSMMNNGMQQPMPQVRTMPSNSLTQNMTNVTQNTTMDSEINTTKNAVEKAVIDAVSKNNIGTTTEVGKIQSELKNDIEIGKNITVQAILGALTLIVALGWHEAIKYYISRHIKFYQGNQHSLLFYALIVTLLLVLYVKLFGTAISKSTHIPFVKFVH
jgi:hypothetical protein